MAFAHRQSDTCIQPLFYAEVESRSGSQDDGVAATSAERVHVLHGSGGEMPFSHDGFSDRVSRYPIPHLSAAEILGLHLEALHVAHFPPTLCEKSCFCTESPFALCPSLSRDVRLQPHAVSPSIQIVCRECGKCAVIHRHGLSLSP